MATPVAPVLGSQMILGAYAKLAKEKLSYSCPSDYNPDVTVVIPCYNEAKRLPYALASLDEQTYEIDRVLLMDDGSKDSTGEVAKIMSELTDLKIQVLRREKSQGKTPTIKSAARSCETDMLMVFDADTILEKDYIEKLRVPHYDDSVASTYGSLRPITRGFKKDFYEKRIEPLEKELELKGSPEKAKLLEESMVSGGVGEEIKYALTEWPVIKFRDGMYALDQHFMKDSYQRIFGTTLFPIGAGVMYKPQELREVFDDFERELGDNLTTSEDIFVGFAFCNKGLKNIQVPEARMVSTEPKISRLPKQTVLWNSSFVQSSYYFGDLSKNFREKEIDGNHSKEPLGWCIIPPLVEKISYPAFLIGIGLYDPYLAAAAAGIEFGMYAATSYACTPKEDRKGLASSLITSAPVRIAMMPVDFYVMGKFGADLAVGNRNWRK